LFRIAASGGSNAKRHILSPIQLRLARFIIAISDYSGAEVATSFHIEQLTSRVNWKDNKNKNLILSLSEEDRNSLLLKNDMTPSPCVAEQDKEYEGYIETSAPSVVPYEEYIKIWRGLLLPCLMLPYPFFLNLKSSCIACKARAGVKQVAEHAKQGRGTQRCSGV
jgi:hypothetical protein